VPDAELLTFAELEDCLAHLHRFAEIHDAAKPRALVLEGMFQGHMGKSDASIHFFRSAISVATDKGMEYELGLATKELGKATKNDNDIVKAMSILKSIRALADCRELEVFMKTNDMDRVSSTLSGVQDGAGAGSDTEDTNNPRSRPGSPELSNELERPSTASAYTA
jgi:hypothetical protein